MRIGKVELKNDLFVLDFLNSIINWLIVFCWDIHDHRLVYYILRKLSCIFWENHCHQRILLHNFESHLNFYLGVLNHRVHAFEGGVPWLLCQSFVYYWHRLSLSFDEKLEIIDSAPLILIVVYEDDLERKFFTLHVFWRCHN